MTQIIQVPQLAWHDPKNLDLAFPDSWNIKTNTMAGHDRPALTCEHIQAAIRNPLGTRPLRELARGKREVVIIFDDMTRVTRVAAIVPHIIQELSEAGIPDGRIRFIAATGTHAPMSRIDHEKKLGTETLARFPVFNHNVYENCTYVGTTSRGISVSINAEVMHCDLKIAIGSVTPHGMVAFSGGGKIIMPGVASIDTIEANHRIPLPEQVRTNYAKNPRRLDMEEVAALIHLDFIVECIFNTWGESVELFAGTEEAAHEACVKAAIPHYLTTKAHNQDIVIANTYAKVAEAPIGMKVEGSVNPHGGDFVLISNAPEGQITHYLMGPWGRTIGGRMQLQKEIPPHINRVIVFSEYPDVTGLCCFAPSDKVLHINTWADVIAMLNSSHGEGAEVVVYPNADIQYFGY